MSGETILVLHASDEAYGSDRSLLLLLLGLRARGYRPVVALPDDVPPGWLSERLEQASIDCYRLPLAIARRRYLRPAGLPGYLRSLIAARRHVRQMAEEVRASVIHCNTSAVLVGAILGRPAGSRLVWHVHEIVTTPRHLARVLRTAPVLAADRVIVVSDAAGRHLIAPGRLRQKVRTVYNGLPDHGPPRSGRTPRSEGPVEIAFVGRLNRWKGPEVLVDALALLRPRAGAVHCTIAGDPPPGESWRAGALRAQAERLGVESRVEFAGLVEEGWRVFWNADIAVVPSTYPEPFGLTTIEAMQASCAVITTSHGAGPELIVDGESGLLVPPRDAAALAAAIDRLLDDPGLIDRLGAAGRARALQLFGVEAMVDGVVAVYRSLLP